MFQNKFSPALCICLLAASLQIPPVLAEEIRIPVGEQAKALATIDMPAKGMSRERVKSLFGEPLEEIPAKGTPPISRWKYQEFTVYFDNNTVIHCVRNFYPKAAPTDSNNQKSNE
jgi:outer membrane protein assembly factor BamE (lipoprotein component of BamABCDE complex)